MSPGTVYYYLSLTASVLVLAGSFLTALYDPVYAVFFVFLSAALFFTIVFNRDILMAGRKRGRKLFLCGLSLFWTAAAGLLATTIFLTRQILGMGICSGFFKEGLGCGYEASLSLSAYQVLAYGLPALLLGALLLSGYAAWMKPRAK